MKKFLNTRKYTLRALIILIIAFSQNILAIYETVIKIAYNDPFNNPSKHESVEFNIPLEQVFGYFLAIDSLLSGTLLPFPSDKSLCDPNSTSILESNPFYTKHDSYFLIYKEPELGTQDCSLEQKILKLPEKVKTLLIIAEGQKFQNYLTNYQNEMKEESQLENIENGNGNSQKVIIKSWKSFVILLDIQKLGTFNYWIKEMSQKLNILLNNSLNLSNNNNNINVNPNPGENISSNSPPIHFFTSILIDIRTISSVPFNKTYFGNSVGIESNKSTKEGEMEILREEDLYKFLNLNLVFKMGDSNLLFNSSSSSSSSLFGNSNNNNNNNNEKGSKNSPLIHHIYNLIKAFSHPLSRHLILLNIIPAMRQTFIGPAKANSDMYDSKEEEKEQLFLIACFRESALKVLNFSNHRFINSSSWSDGLGSQDLNLTSKEVKEKEFAYSMFTYKFLFYLHSLLSKGSTAWNSIDRSLLEKVGLSELYNEMNLCLSEVATLKKKNPSNYEKRASEAFFDIYVHDEGKRKNPIVTPLLYSGKQLFEVSTECTEENCPLAKSVCFWSDHYGKRSPYCELRDYFPILVSLVEDINIIKGAFNSSSSSSSLIENEDFGGLPICTNYEVPDMCGVCGGTYFDIKPCPSLKENGLLLGRGNLPGLGFGDGNKRFYYKKRFYFMLFLSSILVGILVLMKIYNNRREAKFNSFFRRYKLMGNARKERLWKTSRFSNIFGGNKFGRSDKEVVSGLSDGESSEYDCNEFDVVV